MYSLHKGIDAIVTEKGFRWKDLCMKAPIVKPPDLTTIFNFGRRRRKRQDDFDFDGFNDDDFFDEAESDIFSNETTEVDDASASGEYFNVAFYPQPYCDIVEKLEYACLETSIVELWANDGKYDEATDAAMESLTLEDVLSVINGRNKSGVFLLEKDFTSLLSKITRDESGRIIKAEAATMRWFGKMNATDARENPVPGRGEPIDIATFDFEAEMLNVMLNTSAYPEGLESFPNVKRSFGDIAGSTILGDVSMMVIGYMLVFFYVMIMLGRMNSIEQRSFLSTVGIVSIIMGIVVSYGCCSAVNLFFGPMHSVLPFLLLGIGIDDMFVIVQCWDTLEAQRKNKPRNPQQSELSLPDRIGETLSQAGVAITITSVTDIIAFGVGGTTVLPALMSFCLYASVGIVATFFFQCTFFVAWFSLDIKRVEANRNACIPCYKHGEEWKPNNFSKRNFISSGFKGFSKFITKTPVKILVMIVTMTLTGFGIWGNILLEQKFDPTWFLPPETYLARWFVANSKYFPFSGDRVTIWCSDVDYFNQFDKLNELSKKLTNQTDIIDKVDSWTVDFERYMREHFPKEDILEMRGDKFNRRLTQYFFSPKGGRYRGQFTFQEDLKCGQPAKKMVLSSIYFEHKIFSGPSEHVPAMNRVKLLIKEANLTGHVFPLSMGYASWETDEIIAVELYRNIALAMVCIFITTVILLANFTASILVLLCVILSLIDVGGFMHFWGLTIDTVSCNNLIIAIGLCVDYSAHIAHRFLLETGESRNKRVQTTMYNIGPAVLNGGITTTLAFILLAGSRSHVFGTFFKIFFLVVSFGLFHGLVTLPVLLSICGPESHSEQNSEENSESQANSANNKKKYEIHTGNL